MLRFFLIIFISLFLPGQSNAFQKAQIDSAAFDAAVNEILKSNNFKGAGLAVAYKGELVLNKGYGIARETGKKIYPAHENNVWRIASVSKIFTAIAILRLVEQNKIKLDEPIYPILFYNSQVFLKDNRIKAITIRHLLTHRAGFADRENNNDPMFFIPPVCPQGIEKFLSEHTLKDAPNEQFTYSNLGYCMLEIVVVKRGGQSFETALQEMFVPLNIYNITIGSPKNNPENEVAYYPSDGKISNPNNMKYLSELGGAAGLVATPADIVRFLDNIWQGKTPILKNKALYNEMLKPESNKPTHYGFGVRVRPHANGGASLWHHGSLHGTSSYFVKLQNGWTLAVAFNKRKEGKERDEMTKQIDRLLIEATRKTKVSPL